MLSTNYGSLQSKPIVVRVGSDMHGKQEFYIHETLLRASSGLFDSALKTEWKEGQEAAVHIPHYKPAIFGLWLKFLYTGRIYMAEEDMDGKPRPKLTDRAEFATWRDLYALGDYIRDNDFKDALIDAMIDFISVVPVYPASLASYIYPYSISSSTHRAFAVDIFVNLWGREGFNVHKGHPPQFLEDALKAIGPNLHLGIKTKTAEAWFKIGEECKYHDHGDKPCYRTKPAFRF